MKGIFFSLFLNFCQTTIKDPCNNVHAVASGTHLVESTSTKKRNPPRLSHFAKITYKIIWKQCWEVVDSSFAVCQRCGTINLPLVSSMDLISMEKSSKVVPNLQFGSPDVMTSALALTPTLKGWNDHLCQWKA